MRKEKKHKNNMFIFLICNVIITLLHPTIGMAEDSQLILNKGKIFKNTVTDQTQNSIFFTGYVKDENGLPVIGASVMIKGTKIGTVTDIEGKFSLNVDSEKSLLVVSYIGYQSTEIGTNKKGMINITLKENSKLLDDVVVVGYGTMRKSDVTGAIVSVKGDDISKNSSSNVVQAMAGKLSGVQIVQNSGTPGGDVSILIRGVGTINDASPLYVVDGVPVNGGIWYINPSDVESIDVLKDASATAIYGARGANGVVIVTTKKAKEGKAEITLDYSYGTQQTAKMFNMLNASQYATLHNEMRTNAGVALNPTFADPASLGVGTDWLSPLFQTAPMTKINLSFMGGNNKINHATSIGYYAQDGILKNSNFNRLNLQSNISSQILSNFVVKANVNLSNENRRTQPINTVITNAMRMLPSIPIYDENGEYNGPTGNAELNGNALNSIAIVNEQKYTMKGFRMLANISGEWEIIKDLKLKTTGGAELGYEYDNNYIPKFKWGNQESVNTSQSLSSAYEELYLWDNTLSYNKIFGKHKIDAMIGTSYQEYNKHWMSATGSGRASEMTTELDNATKATAVGGNLYSWALMSYMARIQYSFDKRFFVTTTFRADGSSKFGSNNRFGYFPSFSAAWNITNEDFMKDVNWISMLKVRAGYGQTGNQNIDAYAFADKLDVSGVYTFGSQRGFQSAQVPLIYPYKLSNPSIKWESVEQYNIGFDMGFLKDRIVANVDLYLKNTNDMLTKKPVPQTSGTSLDPSDWPPVNIGKVRNTGLEFTITTRNFVGEFNWESNFNISFNKNIVLQLGGPEILNGVSLIRVDEPINSFYGYKMGGIYQNLNQVFTGPVMENRATDIASQNSKVNTSPGDIWFVNINEDKVINDLDRTIIGNPQPDFIFGFNNTLNYKNFDLNFFFQGSYGNSIWNGVRVSEEGMESTYNQLTSTLCRWNGEGSSYTMPRAIYADPNRNNRASSRWIEDGSYIKLKNLALGYTFNKNWMQKTGAKSLRLFVSADNLLTITKYSGLDPEVGLWGLDYGVYPTAKTIMFGASIKF
ncbi:MAG: TonB-dependent receptor [Bacteroidales bacterium]|nr:TonB-dependent receptor [Bacteroidales bacterium]